MSDSHRFVIIGAGQAGGWTALTLRNEGFEGEIVVIGEEAYAPYERPPLSKELLTGDEGIERAYLWPPDSFQEQNITLRLDCRAESIDPTAKTVTLTGGETLFYDRLLIATGARPRLLDVPGADLDGVHVLRAIPDTLAIRPKLVEGATVLVVGGGWIGLEVAAAARQRGARAIVAEAADRLCARALAPDMSDYVATLHKSHNVDLRPNTTVDRFEGDGALAHAVLSDGETVEATLAVIGIGVVPNSEIATAAGLEVNNGIVVDEFARTSDPNIFAAGDVTNHPNAMLGRRVRLESWENAQNQGIAAAKAMLDKGEPYGEVPWFWSDQYDVNIQLVGMPDKWDDVAVRGKMGTPPFLVFYLAGDQIVGAASVNNPRDVRMVRRLMDARKPVDKAALIDPEVKLQQLLRG